MSRERISLVKEEEIKKEELRYVIENDLINSETYNELSEEEQNNVKAVLFEMYAQPVSTPQALSAIEFLMFGLGKLLLKQINPTELSQEDQVEHGVLSAIMGQHPVRFAPDDWYSGYVVEKLTKALENREEYKEKKQSILGYF